MSKRMSVLLCPHPITSQSHRTTMKSVLQYADSGRELPCTIIGLSIVCSIPVLLLLLAIQKCAVHVNCRFLISSWALSLQGYLINVCLIHWQNLFPNSTCDFEKTRSYLLIANAILHMCCTCFEMKIALERIISTRRPHIYHDSGFSYRWNVPCMALPLISGSIVGYAAYIKGHPLALLFPSVVDFFTVLVNSYGIRFLERRFDSLFGKATLNARYQVKESLRIARIMHPIYYISFLLKLSAFIICNSNIVLWRDANEDTFIKLAGAYYIIHCFNCAFSSILLIVHCDFVKSGIASLFGLDRTGKSSRVGSAQSHEQTTIAYFSMLETSWN